MASSAYRSIGDVMPSVVELIYSKKSIGPRTYPCGTPLTTGAHSEKLVARCLLSVKNAVIQFTVFALIWILCLILFCRERYQKLFGIQCTLCLPHNPCLVPQSSRRALLVTGESLIDLVRNHTVCLRRCCFVSKIQTGVFLSLFPLFCNRLM